MKQTIEQRRKTDRIARLAAMTERELAAHLAQIGDELNNNAFPFQLKNNHYEIRDAIRVELASRRERVAA